MKFFIEFLDFQAHTFFAKKLSNKTQNVIENPKTFLLKS